MVLSKFDVHVFLHFTLDKVESKKQCLFPYELSLVVKTMNINSYYYNVMGFVMG